MRNPSGIYGLNISDTTVRRITDKGIPAVNEWQQRQLEIAYTEVFLGAIHYHVQSEWQTVKKAVYVAIGIDMGDKNGVLGVWVRKKE